MTMNDSRCFQIGDLVTVGDRTGGTFWLVVGDDTNETPVYDPEPAYRLARKKAGNPVYRFAYESDLMLAEP